MCFLLLLKIRSLPRHQHLDRNKFRRKSNTGNRRAFAPSVHPDNPLARFSRTYSTKIPLSGVPQRQPFVSSHIKPLYYIRKTRFLQAELCRHNRDFFTSIPCPVMLFAQFSADFRAFRMPVEPVSGLSCAKAHKLPLFDTHSGSSGRTFFVHAGPVQSRLAPRFQGAFRSSLQLCCAASDSAKKLFRFFSRRNKAFIFL